MYHKNKISSTAGVLYLIVVVTGIFSLAYVPNKLFIWDNPTKTFNNILEHEVLFRLSIISSAICYTAYIFLPLVLYKLLNTISDFHAKSMVVLALISIPISFINLQYKYAILNMIHTPGQKKFQLIENVQNQIMLYLKHYNNGLLIAGIFWGLWLLPFGYLVYKSNFLPKSIGVLLMLGCLAYLLNYVGSTINSSYSHLALSHYLGMVPALGEVSICLWLLLIGVREKPKIIFSQL
jgi:hypothetical protein